MPRPRPRVRPPFSAPFTGGGMATAANTADQLERLAGELHSVAFDFREPAATIRQAEARIATVEDIAGRARAAVRGAR